MYDSDNQLDSPQRAISQATTSKLTKISIYEMDTDEDETSINHPADTPDGSDLFVDKKFYLCGNIGSVDECKLRQMIVDHNGSMTANISTANYVITIEALSKLSTSSVAVKPLWVYESCHMRCLLPADRYKP